MGISGGRTLAYRSPLPPFSSLASSLALAAATASRSSRSRTFELIRGCSMRSVSATFEKSDHAAEIWHLPRGAFCETYLLSDFSQLELTPRDAR